MYASDIDSIIAMRAASYASDPAHCGLAQDALSVAHCTGFDGYPCRARNAAIDFTSAV